MVDVNFESIDVWQGIIYALAENFRAISEEIKTIHRKVDQIMVSQSQLDIDIQALTTAVTTQLVPGVNTIIASYNALSAKAASAGVDLTPEDNEVQAATQQISDSVKAIATALASATSATSTSSSTAGGTSVAPSGAGTSTSTSATPTATTDTTGASTGTTSASGTTGSTTGSSTTPAA